MRNVFCGVKTSPDNLNILSEQRCILLPQPNKIQQCAIKPCYTQWIALSWQPVSIQNFALLVGGGGGSFVKAMQDLTASSNFLVSFLHL